MMDTEFFTYQSENSRIKTEIVTKCFKAWATIVGKNHSTIAYLDLFCGPGKYDDGSESTPIIIAKLVSSSPQLCQKVNLFFNDANNSYCNELLDNIKELETFHSFRYPPVVTCGEIDEKFTESIRSVSLIPTFCFLDPFGYKGLSLELIRQIIKNDHSEAVFFYNYNRMNSALVNPVLPKAVESVLGADTVSLLKNELPGLSPSMREAVTLDVIAGKMKKFGAFMLPFTFKMNGKEKTSHHLIHVTRHVLGHSIMKEIMVKSSSSIHEGIGSFEYCSAASQKQLNLFPFTKTIADLEDTLLKVFAGKTLSVMDIYYKNHVGTPFILPNYKTALLRLEEKGAIRTSPAASIRRKKKGILTLSEKTLITFPE